MSARILVVEDNPLNRQLVRDILELHGYEVLEAASAPACRSAMLGSVPDLVLMDIQIPGGGGEALLREMRSDPGLADLVVVALTAFAMQGDRERLLEAGFDGYLSKPIDTRTFAATIERFLGRHGGTDAR